MSGVLDHIDLTFCVSNEKFSHVMTDTIETNWIPGKGNSHYFISMIFFLIMYQLHTTATRISFHIRVSLTSRSPPNKTPQLIPN